MCPAFRDHYTPVGKTSRICSSRSDVTVHPHACGENYGRIARDCEHHGTPPRLWGKQRPCRCKGARHRYTPTPVGKTKTSHRICQPMPVHPHACGENATPTNLNNGINGTPPRLWGKQMLELLLVVGFTVHPHACGENVSVITLITDCGGTPPRLWGKRWVRGTTGSDNHGTPPRLWGKRQLRK